VVVRQYRAVALVLVASMLVGASALAAARADAKPAPSAVELAAWLDDDAPIVAVIQPEKFAAVAALAGRGLRHVAHPLGAALIPLAEATDDDARWRQVGLDRQRPIALSVGAIDVSAAKTVFERLAGLPHWNDRAMRRIGKTYWRTRAVLSVADANLVGQSIGRVADRWPNLHPVAKAHHATIAALLGAPPEQASRLVARLRRNRIVALGWLDNIGGLVAVSVHPSSKLLVVDVVGSFAGVPVVWTRDSREVLGLLSRHRGGSSVADALSRGLGARTWAAGSGLGLWLAPNRVFDTLQALAYNAALVEYAANPTTPRQRTERYRAVSEAITRCERFRQLASHGPLSEMVGTVDADAAGLTAQLAWQLRGPTNPPATFARMSGEDLPEPADLRAVVVARLLTSVRHVRQLPRPRILSAAEPDLATALQQCGSATVAMTLLWGWPGLAGRYLDQLEAAHPWVSAVLAKMLGAAVSLSPPESESSTAWRGTILTTFSASDAAALRGLARAQIGPSETRQHRGQRYELWRSPGLSLHSWAAGQRQWFALHAPRGKPPVLAAAGERSPADATRDSTGAFASAAVQLPELASWLGADPAGGPQPISAVVHWLAHVARELSIDVHHSEDRVVADVRLIIP
jgi:hypothetical protein